MANTQMIYDKWYILNQIKFMQKKLHLQDSKIRILQFYEDATILNNN